MHPKKYEDSNTNHVMFCFLKKALDDYSWVICSRKDAITGFIILRMFVTQGSRIEYKN